MPNEAVGESGASCSRRQLHSLEFCYISQDSIPTLDVSQFEMASVTDNLEGLMYGTLRRL